MTFVTRQEPEPQQRHPEEGEGPNILLAANLARAKQWNEATAMYRAVLARSPLDAAALRGLGQCLLEKGELIEAQTCLSKAVDIRGHYPEAMLDLAQVLVKLQRPAEALRWSDELLQQNARDPETLMVRASALCQLWRLPEVLEMLESAPEFSSYQKGANLRAVVLYQLGRLEESAAHFGRAIAAHPESVELLMNSVLPLLDLHRHEEAIANLDRALAMQPNNVVALNSKAVALTEIGRCRDAIETFARLERCPGTADRTWQFNRALARLLIGDLKSGWVDFEERWHLRDRGAATNKPNFGAPQWEGEPLDGKSILLYSEQGFGDVLQMLRFVPDLARRAARVFLDVGVSLHPLLESLPPQCELMRPAHPPVQPDFACALMSLPRVLGLELSNIPRQVPYLDVPAGLVQHWRNRLGPKRGPRVGLVWSGNPEHRNDHNRSIPLHMILEHAPPLVEFISLQDSVRPSDIEALERWPRLRNFGAEIGSFGDTAALVQLVDIVISVDTGVAHLAGALGRPLLLLLPFSPDWRWLLQRDDSPWYPTATLYRQPAPMKWAPAIKRAMTDLQKYVDATQPVSADPPAPSGGSCALVGKRFRSAVKALGGFLARDTAAPAARAGDRWRERADAAFVVGEFEAAARLYDEGTRPLPGDPSAWIGLARTQLQLGRLQQAVQSLGQAQSLVSPGDPTYVELLLARVHERSLAGEWGAALDLARRAADLQPHRAEVWHQLGYCRWRLGDAADAGEDFDRALALDPVHVDALYASTQLLIAQSKYVEALGRADRLCELHPNNAAALLLRANALGRVGRTSESLELVERASTDGGGPGALKLRAEVLMELGRANDSLAAYDDALIQYPDDVDLLVGCAPALVRAHRGGEALARLDRVLAREPNHPLGLRLKAQTLVEVGQNEEAERWFKCCVDTAKNPVPDLVFQRALNQLLMGQFDRAWPDYEKRWDIQEPGRPARVRPRYGARPWQGEDLRGKTILLTTEQGIGDCIQMLRYVPLLAARAKGVVLGVLPDLAPILPELPTNCKVAKDGEKLPSLDYACPLMSLPGLLGTRLGNIPRDVPYLCAPTGTLAEWRERLGPARKVRVGITWAGNPDFANDHKRSIPLSLVLEHAPPHVEFISLQKVIRATDMEAFRSCAQMRHFGDDIHTFGDTAALVQLVDTVISVDTSVAHLAGALGRPLALLIPFSPDWRWLLQRDDSPWYPTARLYRQPAPGAWGPAIARAMADLPNSCA